MGAAVRSRSGSAAAQPPPAALGVRLVTPALLGAGIAAATAWSVAAAGWVDGAAVAVPVAAVAVLEAALVSRAQVGRAAAALAAVALGILLVVPLTLPSMPDDGGTGLGHVVSRYLDALTTGMLGTSSWSYVVGLCGLVWLLGSWLGWVAGREHRGVLAVLPAWAVLAVNVINAPRSGALALPEGVALALSLVLVARAQLGMLRAGWARRGLAVLPSTDARYVRAACGASALVLVLALVVPPATSTDISARIFHFNLNGRGSGGSPPGATGSGPGGGSVEFSPSTIPGGPLSDEPRNVLTYTGGGTQTYLRAAVDTRFEGGNWLPVETTGQLDGVQVRRTGVRAGQPIPRDRDPAGGGVGAEQVPVAVHVSLGADATGDVPLGLFAGDPDQVSADGVALGAVAAPAAAGESAPLLSVETVRLRSAPGELVTVGLESRATEAELRQASTQPYPAWVLPYAQLSPRSSYDAQQVGQIRQAADRAVGGLAGAGAYDRARAIETFLRTTGGFTYTLTPPQQAPQRDWPVVYFLAQSHQGYCQYFAAAMGAMLRAEGIPARLVNGYGPGAVAETDSRSKTTVHQVTTSNAHTWVEAYFPGYGWIPFEPTPDGVYQPIERGGAAPAAGATPGAAAGASPRASSQEQASSTAAGGAAAAPETRPVAPPGVLALAAALLLAGGAVALALRWLLRPPSVEGLWRRVGVVGSLLGIRRRLSETNRGYARRIADRLPPDTTTLLHRDGASEPGPRPLRAAVGESLAQLAELCDKAAFSVEGIDGRELIRCRRAWRRVCRALPRLAWRAALYRGA